MRIGLKAQIYWLSTGARATWSSSPTNGLYTGPVPSGLQRVTRVKDVSQEFEKEEADGTARDSDWEQVAGTIRKGSISWKMIFDPANDAAHAAMASAFFQSQVYVPLLIADDFTTNTASNYGIWADWEILKFGKGDQLKDFSLIDVSIKPSAFSTITPQRVLISAS